MTDEQLEAKAEAERDEYTRERQLTPLLVALRRIATQDHNRKPDGTCWTQECAPCIAAQALKESR